MVAFGHEKHANRHAQAPTWQHWDHNRYANRYAHVTKWWRYDTAAVQSDMTSLCANKHSQTTT